jgi:hypothetical protein
MRINVMKRVSVAVLLISVVLSLGACNKQSDSPSTVANQSRSESAATLKPVADRTVAPDGEGNAFPAPTSEQQAVCEALEKRATEIDRGYPKRLNSNGDMGWDNVYVNEGVKIEERLGITDKSPDNDYRTLRECIRNADNNLRQEKPLLTFKNLLVRGLGFGMTKEEILASALRDWRIDRCWHVDAANAAAYYPEVSGCSYEFGSEFDEEREKEHLLASFDAGDRLVAWHYTEFLSMKLREKINSSDIIRAERADIGLGIPDTENEHFANWYFDSRSEMSKIGTPKVLEMVALNVSKQGDYWAITINYSDVSKK